MYSTTGAVVGKASTLISRVKGRTINLKVQSIEGNLQMSKKTPMHSGDNSKCLWILPEDCLWFACRHDLCVSS